MSALTFLIGTDCRCFAGGAQRCGFIYAMIVIRRLIDRQRAYTAIFLRGESAQIFPTTDYEHARILQIYLQDRAYEGIHNDHTDFSFGRKIEVRDPGVDRSAEQV